MKKKQVLPVVLSATMAASMLLTGCGNDSGSNSSGGKGKDWGMVHVSGNLLDELSSKGVAGRLTTPRSSYVQYPIEGAEDITLTYWMSVPGNLLKHTAHDDHYSTEDSVQMAQWAQRWQELTGIKIEFIGPATSNSSEVTEKFNTMIIGETLPDIIEWEWTSGYTGGPSQAQKDGALIWLDEYVTSDGPAADLWQYLQDNPSFDTSVKTDDGHYYCFPFARGDRLLGTTSGPIVRNDFLKKVNIDSKSLVTIDDWSNALKALKDGGVKYPLSFESKGYMENLLPGAYGIRPTMYVSAEDGKVHYGKMEQGWKECLQQVVAWMNAGYINPETGDWSGSNTKADILNGDSAIAYGALGSRLGSWNTTAWAEPATYGENFELVGMQFPVKTAGTPVRYSGGSIDYATGSKAHAAISADCKYPELAAAFLNFCYTEAGHNEINFGQEGVAYNGFVETEYGTAAAYSDTIMKASDIAVEMAYYGRGNMSGAFIQSPAYILGYYATDQQKAAVSLWAENDVSSTIMPPVTMTPEEASEYTNLNAQVSTAVDEFRDTVLANKSLTDAEWDAYIKQIKDQGVDRMIELQQQALDRYNAR